MDPITFATLATSAVNILSSFLSKASEGAAKKTGEAVFDVVKTKFLSHETGREILEDFQANPTNEDLAAVLRIQLQKSMAKDSTFASDLKTLVMNTQLTSGKTIITQTAGDNSTQYGHVGGNVTHNSDK